MTVYSCKEPSYPWLWQPADPFKESKANSHRGWGFFSLLSTRTHKKSRQVASFLWLMPRMSQSEHEWQQGQLSWQPRVARCLHSTVPLCAVLAAPWTCEKLSLPRGTWHSEDKGVSKISALLWACACTRVGWGDLALFWVGFFPLLWDEEGEKTVEVNCYFKYLIETVAFETMRANLQNPCRNFPTCCV